MKTEIFDTQFRVYTDIDEHVYHAFSRKEAMDYAQFLIEHEHVDIKHIGILKLSFYKLNS